MSEKKVLSTVTKTLIKNVVRHTDSHNKVVEESEMWRQREKEIQGHNSRNSSYSFLKDRGVDMRYEFMNQRNRSAHMDEEPRSTYWMKELYKAEEADKDRWGHSGYKELYPEHFSSSSSSDEGAQESHKHKDMQKKKSKHKRKKSRKRKQSDNSEFNREEKKRKHSDSSESERNEKKRKKHKHKEKKKRKHKKKKQITDSDS